jgi:hypothetical protein
LSEALRQLGLRPAGGNHATLRKWIAAYGITTDHFDQLAAARRRRHTVPLSDVLVERSTYSRTALKRRLYAEGLKQRRCELCGQDEIWRGTRMALILDHVNGVGDDNRLENLRIVCPNCAATLDTHCGRNVRFDRSERQCVRCGVVYTPRSPQQRYCSRACGSRWDRRGRPVLATRRTERPPYEQLLAEVAELGWLGTGRRYGVSDNAIRKWVRTYEAAAVKPASAPAGGADATIAPEEPA